MLCIVTCFLEYTSIVVLIYKIPLSDHLSLFFILVLVFLMKWFSSLKIATRFLAVTSWITVYDLLRIIYNCPPLQYFFPYIFSRSRILDLTHHANSYLGLYCDIVKHWLWLLSSRCNAANCLILVSPILIFRSSLPTEFKIVFVTSWVNWRAPYHIYRQLLSAAVHWPILHL